MRSDVDVVVVGGGHNGLTAAAYLAASGRSVVVLERQDHFGGVAVSQRVFAGVDALLSRYSYLVSLLPRQIIDDLHLDIRLARRSVSSYTPVGDRGLLVDHSDVRGTAASFARTTGDSQEFVRWQAFYARLGVAAARLWPTMTAPLPTWTQARGLLGDDALWHALTAEPIGRLVRGDLHDDTTRGVALTDALIGTFASADSTSLTQNRCFLYHVIGGGTGDWDVPVGGMGAVSSALEAAARTAGADLLPRATVASIDAPTGDVTFTDAAGIEHVVRATTVLAAVPPTVLDGLLDDPGTGDPPEGSQLKINMLVTRLPRLRDRLVDPATAFAGTLHVNEGETQLETAFRQADQGRIPDLPPCEVYCHSLTDNSILSPELAAAGVHTLTLFGLHLPARLFRDAPEVSRAEVTAATMRSLNSVLAEPLEDCLLRDANDQPCLEVKTPVDLEREAGLPGGHIFHGDLAWPFLRADETATTPAERWGVATAHERILLCGAGARRGGGVSGLGGHNAAMAVLNA
jgi:phytoene dehydrogenase-like protein